MKHNVRGCMRQRDGRTLRAAFRPQQCAVRLRGGEGFLVRELCAAARTRLNERRLLQAGAVSVWRRGVARKHARTARHTHCIAQLTSAPCALAFLGSVC